MAEKVATRRSAFGTPGINAEEGTPHPLSPTDKPAPQPLKGDEEWKTWGTRLPESFIKTFKRIALERDLTSQEAAYEALKMWTEAEHPNDRKRR